MLKAENRHARGCIERSSLICFGGASPALASQSNRALSFGKSTLPSARPPADAILHIPETRLSITSNSQAPFWKAPVLRGSLFICQDSYVRPNVGKGSRPCENVREPRKRRTVFSIAFLGYPSPAPLVFRLTKLRRTFYAQIERASFHTAWVERRPRNRVSIVRFSALGRPGRKPTTQSFETITGRNFA